MTKHGDWIKKTRTDLGFTQKQLAKKINCHDQQLCSIEKGRTFLPIAKIKKTADALSIDAATFLNVYLIDYEKKLTKQLKIKE